MRSDKNSKKVEMAVALDSFFLSSLTMNIFTAHFCAARVFTRVVGCLGFFSNRVFLISFVLFIQHHVESLNLTPGCG